MDSMHKIMDLRNKVHANLHQKNSLALYRRNAGPPRRKKKPEDQVKKRAETLLHADVAQCLHLVDEMQAIFIRWATQTVYRTIGLNPISGFGLGKAFDGDLNKASAMRTALTNVGAQAIGNTVNGAIALSTFKDKDFDTATKAHLDCVDKVLKDPKYVMLKGDSDFAALVERINERYLVSEDDNIVKKFSRIKKIEGLRQYSQTVSSDLRAEYDSYIKSIMVASGALTLAKFSNAYHGYKRNGDSIGYGVLWFMFGGLTAFGQSIAQGYAKNIN